MAEHGFHLVAGGRAPAHTPRIRQEEDGPNHTVAQGAPVAVAVVGAGDADAVALVHVGDEGNRRGVGAERRAREGEPPGRGAVRLAHGLPPAERVSAVVHLVEDDEGRHLVDEHAVHEGLRGDLGVRDGRPVEGARDHAGGVAEGRIETDADAVRRVGPLPLEVLGGGHDDDALDGAPREQLGSEAEGEGRLAGSRRRGGEEVPRLVGEVRVERLGLPGAQPVGRAACRALRVGRREMLRGEGAHVGCAAEGRRHATSMLVEATDVADAGCGR